MRPSKPIKHTKSPLIEHTHQYQGNNNRNHGSYVPPRNNQNRPKNFPNHNTFNNQMQRRPNGNLNPTESNSMTGNMQRQQHAYGRHDINNNNRPKPNSMAFNKFDKMLPIPNNPSINNINFASVRILYNFVY